MLPFKHIDVVPYDLRWPQMFSEEESRLRTVLGANCLDVHHVGSTSVPGLCAKPALDCILVVHNPAEAVPCLESLGYTYKGELNIPFRHYFSKKEPYPVHLHVYEEGHPEIKLNLLFRDYLRNHPKDVTAYANLKKTLLSKKTSFERTKSGFTGYNLGKDAFIRSILQKADFHEIRLMRCTHYAEWAAYGRIYETELGHPISRNMDLDLSYHFVLYKGANVVAAALVERLPDNAAVINFVFADSPHKNQGYETILRQLLEKWIKSLM